MSETEDDLLSPTSGIALTPHLCSLAVARGAHGAVNFKVLALGQADAIELTLGALPPGVTAHITGKTVAHNNTDNFTVTISAAANAPTFNGDIQVTASGGTTHPAHAILALSVS